MIHKVSLLLLSISAVSLLPVQAASRDAAWEKYNQDGLRAVQEQRLPEAEKYLGLALTEAEKFGLYDPRVATALNNIALLRLEQGKYSEAESYFNRALSIFGKRNGLGSADVA